MKLRTAISGLILSVMATATASDSNLKEKSLDMLYRYMPAADSAN